MFDRNTNLGKILRGLERTTLAAVLSSERDDCRWDRMWRPLTVLLSLGLVLSSCSTAESPELDATVRVPAEDLIDPNVPLPENASAIDLGEFAPSTDLTFCEAFGLAPARWVDDAIIPLQYWIDVYAAGRPSPDSGAGAPLDRLSDYAQERMAWEFKLQPDRPVFTPELAADAHAVAVAAVDECEELPLVAAPPGRSDRPSTWDDLSSDEIADRCQAEADDVEAGIEWYRSEFGVTPLHQQQMETASLQMFLELAEKRGGFPEDAFNYFASDFYGVGPDGVATAVPGGACDL